jgi:Co/Zn/Cd efflux system component
MGLIADSLDRLADAGGHTAALFAVGSTKVRSDVAAPRIRPCAIP